MMPESHIDSRCHRCGTYEKLGNGHCKKCTDDKHDKSKTKAKAPNKPCARCGQKPRHRKRSYCFDCERARLRDYHERNKDKPCTQCGDEPRITGTTVGLKCQKKYKNTQRSLETRRRESLKKFGLSIDDYEAMFERQNGVCAICERPQTWRKNNWLCVDHDHSNGRVRGLLCTNCNAALGHFQDSKGTMVRAIAYLELNEESL